MSGNPAFISYTTIVRKEIGRVLRIWPQTILPSVVTMTLYLIIFGEFLGSRIEDFDGVPYIQFILPGLIMMAVITNSYTNVVSSFFSSKFMKSVEEMLISPTPPSVIIAGYVTGGVMRAVIVGFLVSVVATIFTTITAHSILMIFLFIFFTALLFSLAGMINAVYAKKFDDINIVPTFVLTPLTYLGGVFYSISLLPEFWQYASLLNPVLYMVNGFRYGFLGISDINVYLGLTLIIASCIVLYLACLYLIKKGVGLKD